MEHFNYSPREISVDTLIVGGGPAGTTAAIVLARAGYSVCLIEASHYEHVRVGEHLPPHGKPILTALDLWGIVEESGAIGCPGVRSAWGNPQPHQRDYLFNLYGNGWHLDRTRFDWLLAKKAELSGAIVSLDTRLDSISRKDNQWDAIAFTGDVTKKVRAKMLIDASGRRAVVAHRLGARRMAFDRLFSVVAWFENPNDPDRTLLVEAVENGWWYSLPLPGNRFVGAFMTDVGFLKGKSPRSQEFIKSLLCLTQLTKDRLLKDRIIAGPIVHPASSEMLDRISGPGWLAVGDAAMSIDPLSSNGIAHALESAKTAAAAAMKWLDGDAGALDEYAATQTTKLDPYLARRTEVYREETRWFQHPFWRRRHVDPTSIFLSPDDVLVLINDAKPIGPVAGLSRADLHKLCLLCKDGNAAHTIVRRFCDSKQHEQSEQVIFALQNLVICGILEWQMMQYK